ncbi:MULTISPECIES: TrbC/VirB2 family protein [Corynebacterium]|uniref:TrbC/VirB2 family protein n=1 Tax=Corynebacterium TaxID=1716 RepID=UPI00124D42CD|nr:MULTISPECIES: TrbC/VirB2 family protein [Corynebacterium]
MIEHLVAAYDMANVVLAQMPGENLNPQAPGDFGTKFDRGLNFAQYIGIGVAIIGVIVAGASMALSRREGTSEEATGMALRIGIGATLIGGASGLIAAFL